MHIVKKVVFIFLLVLLIAVATFLYAPMFAGLKPSGTIGMKIFFWADLIALILNGYSGNRLLFPKTEKQVSQLPKEIKPEEVGSYLIKMRDSSIFSDLLGMTIVQLSKADAEKAKLSSILDEKFQRNSISWNKFYSVIVSAHQAIIQSDVLIARRIEQFDTGEFIDLQKLISSGEYKKDTIPDDIQEEKYQLFVKRWDSIQNLYNVNERLLVKMDALEAEIAELGDNNVTNENGEILSDIEELISQTHYYE